MSALNQYYIQDSRGYVGNDVLWWRPNGNGYTTDLNEAGVYTREEAYGKRETDVAWPVEHINPLITRTVDMQRLR
jgi:hypothetical protein